MKHTVTGKNAQQNQIIMKQIIREKRERIRLGTEANHKGKQKRKQASGTGSFQFN